MTQPADRTPLIPPSVLFAALAFALAVAAYVPTIEGPFVWDDQTLLMRTEIVQLKPLYVYLSRPFWLSADWDGGAGYYRPLAILSLALDQAFHGGNPTGFHFTNLLLHGLCTLLVFGLARRLRASPEAALLGSLLFAWFPRLSEAAGWISGRTDVLATFFSLAALFVTLGSRRGRPWIAALLVLFGLLSKEVALAAGVSILGYEWLQGAGERPGKRLLGLLPTGLTFSVYLVLRTRILGHGMHPGDIGAGQRVQAALESIGRYGFMLVDGWQPRLNIGSLGEANTAFVALGSLVLLLLIPLGLRFRPARAEALLLACSGIAIGLVLHILPIHSTVVVADRFLYLPVAALAPVLVGRVSALESVPTRQRWLAAFALLILSYLPFTWQRAKVWGDAIEFWGTAVREQAPQHNALSHLGLASLLAEHGMWEEAMSVLNRVQTGDARNFLLARHNQAQLLAMNGETDRALAVLEEAARLQPMPRFYSTIALLHTVAGHEEQAHQAMLAYARMVSDEARVAELEKQVASATQAKPSPIASSAPLAERIERAKRLSKRQLFRVAMTELVTLIDDPAMTSDNLRGILVFALGYGTPSQVSAIYRRLLELDPRTPEEFSLLVSARDHEVERLKQLCRQLGIEVRS